jgi:hypothetical protein
MPSHSTHYDKVILLENEEFQAFVEYERKEIGKKEKENLATALEFYHDHLHR